MRPSPPSGTTTSARSLHADLEANFDQCLQQLPLLPDVVTEVMRLARSEDADSQQLAELIHRDPGIAAHFLRIANSAAYAGTQPIVSLRHAIVRLGMTSVHEIVVSVAMKAGLFRAPGYEGWMRRCWNHSFASALHARNVARRCTLSVETAFLGGLLHQVGRPMILGFLARSRRGQPLPDDTLDALFAACETRVSARAIRAWKLPETLAAAIEQHPLWSHGEASDDVPLRGATARLAACIYLARGLAARTLASADAPDRDAVAREPAAVYLGLYPDDVEALLAEAVDIRAAVQASEAASRGAP